jgi:hypothetical protein
MEGYCSTGQSPQWAVVPMEAEEEAKLIRSFNVLVGILVYMFFYILFVCFPGVTTHCGCIFHSPVAGFSLLVVEVS